MSLASHFKLSGGASGFAINKREEEGKLCRDAWVH